jgi:hypothetical protein
LFSNAINWDISVLGQEPEFKWVCPSVPYLSFSLSFPLPFLCQGHFMPSWPAAPQGDGPIRAHQEVFTVTISLPGCWTM